MSERANILLVSVDSLRADHCGFMGYEKDTTPTLDAMAEEGLMFENAIAPGPSTPASLPATFTGHYPATRMTGSREVPDMTRRFRAHLERHETIAEHLSRLGYNTAGFTSNPWTCRHFGFDSGFDHFQDFLNQDSSSGIWRRILEGKGSQPLAVLRLMSNWMEREAMFKPWAAFYDEIIEWTQNADEPYFLWVFLLDPHFPYLPSDEHRSQSRWRTYEANLRLYLESQTTPYSPRVHEQLVTAYDDAVRYTDDFFKCLREDLEPNGPCIVVHADHGEAFGEHGTYGHHRQLYDSNVRVPLVVSGVRSETVIEPVSIRSIPDLVARLARKDDPASVSKCSVITKSGDGSISAVRGRKWLFINENGDKRFFFIKDKGERAVEDDILNTLAQKVLDARAESGREEDRIAAAMNQTIKSTNL